MEKQNAKQNRQEADKSFRYQRREMVKPVDPGDLAFALELGLAGADGRMPMESPARREVTVEIKPGHFETLNLKDTPVNRMWLAIRNHCGDDNNKFTSMFWRITALFAVSRTDQMKPWARENENEQLLHSATIEAAAVMPLHVAGDFEPAQFAERVGEIAKRVVCG